MKLIQFVYIYNLSIFAFNSFKEENTRFDLKYKRKLDCDTR